MLWTEYTETTGRGGTFFVSLTAFPLFLLTGHHLTRWKLGAVKAPKQYYFYNYYYDYHYIFLHDEEKS